MANLSLDTPAGAGQERSTNTVSSDAVDLLNAEVSDFEALQVEMCRRASTPFVPDPLSTFTSEMSRDEILAQFSKLALRSRENLRREDK